MAELAASHSRTASDDGNTTTPSPFFVTQSEDDESRELESVLYLNIATCYVKLGKASEAIINVDKSMALNASNWKAYLRKGEALALKRDCDGAISLYHEAGRHTDDPVAKACISSSLRAAAVLDKEQRLKQKQAFSTIFKGKHNTTLNDSASILEGEDKK